MKECIKELAKDGTLQAKYRGPKGERCNYYLHECKKGKLGIEISEETERNKLVLLTTILKFCNRNCRKKKGIEDITV